MQTIDYSTLKVLISQGCNLFDIRNADAFETGFIQSSLFIAPADHGTIKALELLSYHPLGKSVVITDAADLDTKVVSVLNKVLGNEYSLLVNFNVIEAGKHGIETDMVIGLYAEEFALDINHDKQINIFDLRKPAAFEQAHIRDSENIALSNIASIVLEFDKDDKIYLISSPPSTALTTASMLRANGFNFCRPLLEEFNSLHNLGLTIKGKAAKRTKEGKPKH